MLEIGKSQTEMSAFSLLGFFSCRSRISDGHVIQKCIHLQEILKYLFVNFLDLCCSFLSIFYNCYLAILTGCLDLFPRFIPHSGGGFDNFFVTLATLKISME